MKRGWKILAGILAGLLFLYFVFLPQWRDYKQVRQDLEKIQRELEGDRRLIASLPRERERLEVLRQDPVIKRLSLDLREGVDVILLGLQASARNVKVTGFEPGLPEEGKALIALPFKFQVEGNYPAIFSLVESLEPGGRRPEEYGGDPQLEAYGRNGAGHPDWGDGSPGLHVPGCQGQAYQGRDGGR